MASGRDWKFEDTLSTINAYTGTVLTTLLSIAVRGYASNEQVNDLIYKLNRAAQELEKKRAVLTEKDKD